MGSWEVMGRREDLDRHGNIWEYLGSFGKTWEDLGSFVKICEEL